jgi:hypothetical protein
VSKRNTARLPRAFGRLALTQIGETTREKNIVLETNGRVETLRPGAWDPFR